MQRVLSFQMSREFGETSAFVTKRMCFSSVFAAGFMCVLGGFLLGRFAVERTLHVRAERARLELADNGLRATEHLQHLLLEILSEAKFKDDYDYVTNGKNGHSDPGVRELKKILSDAKLFQQVVETETCAVATVRGFFEPDRYIVFSASGDGISVAIELAKSLGRIHVGNKWKPRRTMIFCTFLGPSDCCYEELPGHVKSKVISYIAVHGNAIQENGYFVASGSNMMQATIMQSIDRIRNFKVGNKNLLESHVQRNEKNAFPRLALDMPHAILSFANKKNATTGENENSRSLEMYQKILLTQIVGMSIWRLSDSVITSRWEPKNFYNEIDKALDTVQNEQLGGEKDQVRLALSEVVRNVNQLNEKLDSLDKTNSFKVRMTNDLLLDLDRALLCSDEDSHSKTDPVIFPAISQAHLIEIEKCFREASQVLKDQ